MAERSATHEMINDLVRPDEVDRFSSPLEARKKAMDYLARREHSRSELVQKMSKAGFDSAVSEDAVDKLFEEGLQSDRRFVESFIQSRINQGKGPARIRADLGQRGLSDGLVSEMLNEADADWFALATAARRRKFGTDEPGDFKEKARQMRFLQYRGFESEQVQAAFGNAED